jgi:hypothetical protein
MEMTKKLKINVTQFDIRVPIRLIEPWRCTAIPDWRKYAARMLAGDKFPPVLVIRQSSKVRGYPYRLFDGFHRARAAKRIGRKSIEAIVIAREVPSCP